MNYISFAKELKNFPTFSRIETEKLQGKVYEHRLTDWQKKGYIKRVANGIFIFADESLDEMYLFYLANKIYEPSYISLESAFSFYGFIPEAVYNITSVSTRKKSNFNYEKIAFTYRTIHPKYNFGYTLLSFKNTAVKIAEPEKAIIDFFYLNADVKTPNQIEEMRFNPLAINERVDWQKIENYLKYYDNKSLTKRIYLMRDCINNA